MEGRGQPGASQRPARGQPGSQSGASPFLNLTRLALQVGLAPVELVLASQASFAITRYMDHLISGLIASGGHVRLAQHMGLPIGGQPTSLHSMVVDSYVRTRTAVPLSISSFLPKFRFFCPQVRSRGAVHFS